MPVGSESPRFLRLSDVADILNVSERQVYALVRRGDLPAIRVGGRGVWRVESEALERYITDQYTATRDHIAAHPFVDEETEADARTESGVNADT
ncbi:MULTISPECIES: helix-turn-helix domain-containing protein [Mumia]|uniref:helix-turn-helix domain-containing protein n=1 Tax=Mumia TaxID=1546255 RepID=UPI00141FB182|nr:MULTISPECIES: helix-turn-helix domain-containing protein [unclassified Mumia]QMW65564.1 helix-turn-helix domain-containing protein [Mumia sp. ZJ1417]